MMCGKANGRIIVIGTMWTSLLTACAPPSGPRGPDEETETPRSQTDQEPATEPVRFASGDNVLAGTLYLPRTPGPHPAVALVLGSDPVDRTYGGIATALARHFARHGFACLSWDKPGVGESTGDFHAQTFRDRAEEALAAVGYLRKRPDIQADHIGLWGHSQGGSVVPLAASLSKDVAWVIAVAGWQGPTWKQDAVRVEAEMRADGCPSADIAEAVAFAKKRMDLIRGAGPFEELDQAQEAVKNRPWMPYVHRCDRALFDGARSMVNEDTEKFWEGVHCPVLVIYGDKDKSSGPPDPLVDVIRRGMAKAGNKALTVQIFADADHSLCRAKTDGGRALGKHAKAWQDADGPDFVPGYCETMTDWLRDRITTRP
jgi:pimeloyl-ACP methyl ester carboxylesterase